MLTLYGAEGAGSVAPQALLAHLGVPFELRLIDFESDENQSPDFLSLNPRGQIPVLLLDDGTAIPESMAILLHIAENHEGNDLLPPEGSMERAQLYRWMSFIATNVYEGMLRVLYPESYTTDENTLPVVESALEYLDAAFTLLEAEFEHSPGLVQSRTGVCELYLGMILTWHPQQESLYERFPNLKNMLNRVLEMDGVEEVFRENKLI